MLIVANTPFTLRAIILNVVILNDLMLNVIMLSDNYAECQK